MSYVLLIDSVAEQQIADQPEHLRAFIQESLLRLASSPSSVRRVTSRRYQGQVVEFKFDREVGVVLWVTVKFRFGADEQTLHIEGVEVEFGE